MIYAEKEMGERVAHSLSIRGVLDYLDVARGFGIVKLRPPEPWVGRSLKELDLGSLQISPVALRRGQEVTVNPPRDDRARREGRADPPRARRAPGADRARDRGPLRASAEEESTPGATTPATSTTT